MGLTKDCPVKTIALSKKILKKNFPDSKVHNLFDVSSIVIDAILEGKI